MVVLSTLYRHVIQALAIHPKWLPKQFVIHPHFVKEKKNFGNIFGGNEVKLLAQVASACPVQEIYKCFSIVLAFRWTAEFLCKQVCRQLSSVSRKIYISVRERKA